MSVKRIGALLIAFGLLSGTLAVAMAPAEEGEVPDRAEYAQIAKEPQEQAEDIRRLGEKMKADAELQAYLARLSALEPAGRRVVLSSSRMGPLVRTLVVRSSEVEPLTLGATMEDMNVMSRIFHKALSRELGKEYSSWRTGVVYLPSLSNADPQSVYLEGYGALFIMHVKFPLVPLPKPEAPELVPDTDRLWIETKREMYGPLRPDDLNVWVPFRSKAEYDEERVEDVKETLLEALKHATNIRGLKPDESVAVAVMGSPIAGDVGRVSFGGGGGLGGGGGAFGGGGGGFSRGGGSGDGSGGGSGGRGSTRRMPVVYSTTTRPSEQTVLTIHVKKSDVDAFAEGELSYEEFRDRAAIVAY